jgi:hypothetical protein
MLDVSMTTSEKMETMSRAGMAGVVQAFAGLAIFAGVWGAIDTGEMRDRFALLAVVAVGIILQVGLIAYYRLPVTR